MKFPWQPPGLAAGRIESILLNDTGTLRTIGRILLFVLIAGMAGLATELLFLEHVESPTQLIPLLVIGLGLIVVVWHAVQGGPASALALQGTMLLFLVSGALGVYLHFRANAAFQREIDPAIAGMDLFWKVMAAKAPPALAPGSMAQLGLIGLAYTYCRRSIT